DDPASLLVQGGWNGANWLSDLWSYEVPYKEWQQLNISPAPMARSQHVAVWDKAGQRVWLHGDVCRRAPQRDRAMQWPGMMWLPRWTLCNPGHPHAGLMLLPYIYAGYNGTSSTNIEQYECHDPYFHFKHQCYLKQQLWHCSIQHSHHHELHVNINHISHRQQHFRYADNLDRHFQHRHFVTVTTTTATGGWVAVAYPQVPDWVLWIFAIFVAVLVLPVCIVSFRYHLYREVVVPVTIQERLPSKAPQPVDPPRLCVWSWVLLT
ncbi:unnamed protein product, partial [Symbiodinium necroappetens]